MKDWWRTALNELDLKFFAVTLKLRPGTPAAEGESQPAVWFPFFHHTIVHSLMKEVVRASAHVASIPYPGNPSAVSPPNSIPPGLIPCAIESGRSSFSPCDSYRLGITIVPRFSPPAASICHALQSLGSNCALASPGVQLAGNFDVSLVESLDSLAFEELEAQAALLEKEERITIDLLAPLHGKSISSGRPFAATEFDFQDWLMTVHWRCFGLINGRRPDRKEPADSPPLLQGASFAGSSLFDVNIPKSHPKPGQQPYEVLGVIGSFSINRLPADWLPWLLLGQYLHVGEGTGWGLGRFRVRSAAYRERFHPSRSLLDRVLSPGNLVSAHLRVNEVPGLDCVPPTPPTDLVADTAALSNAVHSGSYIPGPLHGFEVTVHGKIRAIAVAGHADRLLQRSATDVLSPILDSLFNQCSFGYRRGRSRADAARAISQAWDQGFRFALDADISAFFDHVDWGRLFAKLGALFPDEPLVPLLRQWIAADVVYRGQRIHRTQGLPLGISVSPLLANLYLDDLDDDLDMQGFRLVRYADDFVVLTRDIQSAERARAASQATLHHLGLELNPDKTQIVSLDDGFSYLGYLFLRSLVVDPSLTPHPEPDFPLAPVVKSSWIAQLHPEQMRALARNGQLSRLPAPLLALPPIVPATSSSCQQAQATAPVSGSIPAQLTPHPAAMPPLPDQGRAASAPGPEPPNRRWGLYVVGRETGISVHYNHLSILREGAEPAPVPLENVSHVVSIGSGRISSPVMLALGERGIPIFFCKRSGELAGVYHPHGADRSQEDYRLWLAQSAAVQNPEIRLCFARAVVAAKLARQAETLASYATPEQRARATQIQQLALSIPAAPSIDALLGLEGSASRTLFDGIQDQLLGLTRDWPFLRRERRPPPDPVNALLSFGYTMLYIHAATALWTAGLLPQIGLLHALKPGHLALASDLVEEFRHHVDRLVVRLINRREIRAEHFLHGPEAEAGACRLTDDGRRIFILAIDGVLQGVALNDPTASAQPPLRRMARQALHIADFLAGRSAAYNACEA
jgi:CRISPR-associated protein Cas1